MTPRPCAALALALALAPAPQPSHAFLESFLENVGHTFSGVSSSVCTGAVELSQVDPFSFGQTGHQDPQILFTTRITETGPADCGGEAQCTSETVQDRVAAHFHGTLPAGFLTNLLVLVTDFQNLDFDASNLWVSVESPQFPGVTWDLFSVDPPSGADLAFQAFLPWPRAVGGTADFDVIFQGQVDPVLTTNVEDAGCGDGRTRTTGAGSNQAVLSGVILAAAGEETTTNPGLVVFPGSASVAPGGTQQFSAFDCRPDSDGNPERGPDGVPGTDDDLCDPAEADWSTIGGVGMASPAVSSSTTLLLASEEFARGQIVAAQLARIGAANVEVGVADPFALAIDPSRATVADGDTRTFSAWSCPRDASGDPDAGPDGAPGTPDDACSPTQVSWDVAGDIGSLSSTQDLTLSVSLEASLLPDVDQATGQVTAATPAGLTAQAEVRVRALLALLRDQERCVDTHTFGLDRYFGGFSRELRSCLRQHQRGGDMLDACLPGTRTGRLARIFAQLERRSERRCMGMDRSGAPRDPGIFTTDADTVADAGDALGRGLAEALFGPALSGVILRDDDRAGATCQARVAGAAVRCADTKLDEARRCFRDAVREEKEPFLMGAMRPAELASCILADRRGRIERACDGDAARPDRLRRTIERLCRFREVDLGMAFPHCGGADDVEGIHACIDARIECEACLALARAHEVPADCDELDNGVRDGSCLEFQ